MNKLKGLSLFANIGVAEALLEEIGVEVKIANELDERRARFYKHLYPETEMITGDITREEVYYEIINKAKEAEIDFIMATPPCQGMSTVGKKDPTDPRNQLISYALKAIIDLKPMFVLLENVPRQNKTKVRFNDKEILIPDFIKSLLSSDYHINDTVLNVADFGVPQNRERSIFLLTRKDIKFIWEFPEKENSPIITLEDAIGHLPSLDPLIQGYKMEEILKVFPDFLNKKKEGEAVSKWHTPPKHKIRHIEVMMYTPEGKSALENDEFYPKKVSGERIVGFKNTYKRQWWDKPAYTVTTYNGAVCSHDNVHPGRPVSADKYGRTIYSDPRVLSIYELLIVMSLPLNWNIPEWADESVIRHSIGEGIPPLMVKKLFRMITNSSDKIERRHIVNV
ncbi:DNA cytosine methyltransferase [Bacillus luteolus]|uniref:DNA (cytosine-5-)-methyltransferase n=1 Tax=Litchfieldia luteola TaxID=682179 RepID=A0ABR9QHB1_9BACI|nr:DNA cytosine methyltransferase [Cytobacillus luteolus]MBE4907883.1 DNA cytosine methyltransferase [Cytobacillus luteolus]MBP1943959.1 DNA (cytosine-5)-methyltransferase 1 [Cytobacillus luteolus]